jgi:hypothetical protein
MQMIPKFIIFLSLTLFVSCKKNEKIVNGKGIVFYPSNFNFSKNSVNLNFDATNSEFVIFGISDFRGARLTNGLLTLPFKNNDTNFFRVDGSLQYNFINGTTQINNFPSVDSNMIYDILAAEDNRYLMAGTDPTHKYKNKIMWMDNQFHPISQMVINDGIINRNFYQIEPLTNGSYVITYDGPFPMAFMSCVDKDLNFKWTTTAPNSTFLWVGNNSILSGWENLIIQYNYNGKKIKALSMPPDYTLQTGVSLQDGFLLIGSYSRADKYDVMFVNKYDDNLNLIQSTLIETKGFSNNPNYRFYTRSNILVEKEGYFFVVNMRDPTNSRAATEEAVLIKLNANLDPEIIKSIDNRRKQYENSFLARYQNQILCVGPALWNGQAGYSFIRLDIKGNILQ